MKRNKRKRKRFVLKNPKRLFEIIGVFLYLALVFVEGNGELSSCGVRRNKIAKDRGLAQYNNSLEKMPESRI